MTGVDDFSTGFNDEFMGSPSRFRLVRESIQSLAASGRLTPMLDEVDVVFHLAAHGSVPKSIRYPMLTYGNNVSAFINLLEAIRESQRKPRLVFASSSSIYGDCPSVMKREADQGSALSPYAASKQTMESYAKLYAHVYGIQIVGLRYFNVFGPRQRADSAYAAVIPSWTAAMLRGDPVVIYGDGNHQRDFTPVSEVVWATRSAAEANLSGCTFLNVGMGNLTSLRFLSSQLGELTGFKGETLFSSPRGGDVVASGADVTRLRQVLGERPVRQALPDALRGVVDWHRASV